MGSKRLQVPVASLETDYRSAKNKGGSGSLVVTNFKQLTDILQVTTEVLLSATNKRNVKLDNA